MPRFLANVLAATSLIAAVSTVDTPAIVWDPPWPARLALAGFAVVLAVGTLITNRRAIRQSRTSRPTAS